MHKMHILLLLQLMLYILNICFVLLLLFMMRSNDEIGWVEYSSWIFSLEFSSIWNIMLMLFA